MPGDLPTFENECFFIAPIGEAGSAERERSDGILKTIVSHAAAEVGLTAIRADQIAEPGQITIHVIEHVLRARGAVVDLTGLNPNVFYELAIRHTARLPVALIAEKDTKLPFDIAQMNTIFFDSRGLESADYCRAHIAAHLRKAFDKGAVDSPITVTVDVRTLQAGSVVERNIAELVTTVDEMTKGQRMLLAAVEKLRQERYEVSPSVLDERLRQKKEEIFPRSIEDLSSAYYKLETMALSRGDSDLRSLVEDLSIPVRYLLQRLQP